MSRVAYERNLPMPKSKWEQMLAFDLKAAGLVPFCREFVFAPPRRWRADFAYPDMRILIEVEGGTWSRGRHTRGKGYEADCEKYNAAALAGWLVLRFTANMVEDGRALEATEQAYKERLGLL